MRPRLLHLGYDPRAAAPAVAAASFNEAEAFTPRILRATNMDTGEEFASMRPRLLHLGYMK